MLRAAWPPLLIRRTAAATIVATTAVAAAAATPCATYKAQPSDTEQIMIV